MTANLQETFLRFHGWVYQATQGRLGHHMIGVPTLLLETIGRRSGDRRVGALVYAKDDSAYVVVASNNGSDRPPGWLFNLTAKPQVEIRVGRARMAARAEVIEPGNPEYARLWSLVNTNNHNRYRGYQTKTKRPIPLVTLTPS